MSLWTLLACTSFDLTLVPVTVDNQDPFGDADAVVFEVEHADGTTTSLDGGASGTLELSGLPSLEGSTIAVRVTSGGETTAFGRTPALTITGGGQQTHYVLVSEVDSFAWLEDAAAEHALAEAVAVGDGRFLVIGGVLAKKSQTNWVFEPDTASDAVLVFDVDATGGTVAFASYPGLLPGPRVEHSATLMEDGTVLVAGGATGYAAAGTETDSAVVIDPWAAAGPEVVSTVTMNRVRAGHNAALNSDGKVVLFGGTERTDTGSGYSLSSIGRVEVYDPETGAFEDSDSLGSDLGITTYAEAVALGEHGALWCGGFDADGANYTALDQCYLMSPDSSEVKKLDEDPLPTGLIHYQLTSLGDGRALATGGLDVDGESQEVAGEAVKSAWIFDPEGSPGSRWSAAGNMILARQKHSAVALPGGDVLVVGGSATGYLVAGDDDDPLACAEVFSYSNESFSVVEACGESDDYNVLPGRTQLPAVAYDPLYGSLVFGGLNDDGASDVAALYVASPEE